MIQESRAYPVDYQQKTLRSGIDPNPTVEENIDERIRFYESELVRLKQSKEDLAPLLKMRIRDIRLAMDY